MLPFGESGPSVGESSTEQQVEKRPSQTTQGIFITIEGLDGSGKTTQALLLEEWLHKEGFIVFRTYEPGGTQTGDDIRDSLLDKKKDTDKCPTTELFLFNASRTQLVAEEIRPRLERGEVVICDRFADSTRAYQGFGQGLLYSDIEDTIRIATGGLQPDLTILLDLTPEEAFARRRQAHLNGEEWNRKDDEVIEFRKKVYEGYRKLAKREPNRWVVVNGRPSIKVVAKEIKREVTKKYPHRIPSAKQHSSAKVPSRSPFVEIST